MAQGYAGPVAERCPTPIARGSFGQASEWELRAREEALSAIAALSEAATFAQMATVARNASQKVMQAYEHKEKCASVTAEISSSLTRRFPFSSSHERAKAEEVVRADSTGLPVGAKAWEIDAARDVALVPFVAAEAQKRAEREAQQAKARLEVEAEKYLDRVFYYLAELQADPDGWDFEGELFQYAKEISEAIKPNLIEAMPLDFFAGRLQVEKVDEWLAAHL